MNICAGSLTRDQGVPATRAPRLSVAQWIERALSKRRVAGSTPAGGTEEDRETMSRKKNWNDRPIRRGGESHIALGPGPYVSVYCCGRDDSPHSKYKIASFVPSDQAGSTAWVENTLGYASHSSGRYFKVMPPVTQWLEGDQWLVADARRDSRDQDGFRSRWSLRCPTCSLSKTYASPVELGNAISALALLRSDDGIFEVSLRAFIGHLDGWRNSA